MDRASRWWRVEEENRLSRVEERELDYELGRYGVGIRVGGGRGERAPGRHSEGFDVGEGKNLRTGVGMERK